MRRTACRCWVHAGQGADLHRLGSAEPFLGVGHQGAHARLKGCNVALCWVLLNDIWLDELGWQREQPSACSTSRDLCSTATDSW